MTRFGIVLLTDQPWAEAGACWRGAEELGFDHAWTYDHLIWGGLAGAPWRGAFPVLAAAAGVTERIGLGTLVTAPNFRHPFSLLREVQALDDVSGGRFTLALGAGGDLDSRVLGQPELSARQRVDRLQEFSALYRRLSTEDDVSATGDYFTTAGARTAPSAAGVPVVLAGDGPRSVAYAARHGDGWVTTGPWGADDEEWFAGLARSVRTLDDELAAAGRDVAAFPRHVLLNDIASFTLRSAGAFEDAVGRVVGLGFTDVITHWPRAEAPFAGSTSVLEQVAADVLPRWR